MKKKKMTYTNVRTANQQWMASPLPALAIVTKYAPQYKKATTIFKSVDFRVGNEQIKSESISSSGVVSATYEGGGSGTKTVTITAHDSAEYTGSASGRFSVATAND